MGPRADDSKDRDGYKSSAKSREEEHSETVGQEIGTNCEGHTIEHGAPEDCGPRGRLAVERQENGSQKSAQAKDRQPGEEGQDSGALPPRLRGIGSARRRRRRGSGGGRLVPVVGRRERSDRAARV
jgi:hypothetical protein